MADMSKSRIANLEKFDVNKKVPKFDSEDEPNYEVPLNDSICPQPEKILKIAFASILFLVVLGSGYVSRISLHILIWHIQPPVHSEVTINRLGGLLKSNCSSCDPSANNNASGKCPSEIDTGAVDETWIWALFLVTIAPYAITFLSTTFRIIFKTNKPLKISILLQVLLIETVHSIGLSMLAFVVLPSLDPASASVLYMAVGVFLPAVDMGDKLVSERRKMPSICDEATNASMVFPLVGLVLQITGVICISIFIETGWLGVVFVIGVVLTSVKYWENFVQFGGSKSIGLRQIKRNLQYGRTKVTCVASLWKIIITFLSVITIFTSRASNSTEGFLALFNEGMSTLSTIVGSQNFGDNGLCGKHAPFLVAAVNIACSYLCYKASKVVCVINCQRFGFSIPLMILPLATTGTLIGLMYDPSILNVQSCDLFFSDWCIKDEGNLIQDNTLLFVAFVALVMSILFITRHVWKTNGYRHGETARIFVSPFYCGLFLDLSLLFNRRRIDSEYDIITDKISEDTTVEERSIKKKKRPILYACAATMWHETANEMTQLLKSIFRLDSKQCLNNLMAEKASEEEREKIETFEMEAHVFFDDAFDPIKEGEKYPDVNQYVKTFILVLEEAGSIVHGRQIKIPDGTIYRTPYGAKIEWTLPGGNNLVVHLKDKNKIRHKKRWSQIMYMRYILNYKLWDQYGEKGIQEAAENTYILALDGDVDFEPEAVMSLMRRMIKSSVVGAACGRIHPIGSGPMVWYQMFEYAISHWLQKATEHVIGCVLCSPGCFSLFRGSAILAPNVLKTYSTVAKEAQHFVQYDQGEDRWLCTLLLKQGWKVEYCAESDAYTFAPEGFYEFYNQRRRWTPSTMANILDLILDWKKVTKNNENISLPYIIYHVFLFVSTLLTPGTVFMIIFGAIIVGFDSIPPWLSLILNLIPVAVFMLMTLYASSQRQLQYAAILSSIYVIVMVIVLIGVIRDAAADGMCSMSTIFVIFVAGVFVIAAVIHPKEFICLLPGLLYFLAIPSMSMLMFLYSIGNLHVVSWGTRETKTVQTDSEKGKPKFKPEQEEKGHFFSFGKFFSCICCPTNDYTKEDFLYKNMLNQVKSVVKPETEETLKETLDANENKDTNVADQNSIQDSNENLIDEGQNDVQKKGKQKKKKEKPDVFDTFHVYADKLAKKLSDQESRFWKKTIKRYLKPLEKDEQKEKQIAEDLIDLRNRVSLFVFLLNAILVTVMYGLTQVNAFSGTLTILADCNGNPDSLKIVPIALLFSIVFGILLLIQFFGMLYHRFSTLIHICASTHIFENEEAKEMKINEMMLEFLVSPVYEQVPPKSTLIADKNRKTLEMNRTMKPEEHKKYMLLRDVVLANAFKMKSLKGSLYVKRNQAAQKCVDKWRNFASSKPLPIPVNKKKPKMIEIVDQAVVQHQKQIQSTETPRVAKNQVAPVSSSSDIN